MVQKQQRVSFFSFIVLLAPLLLLLCSLTLIAHFFSRLLGYKAVSSQQAACVETKHMASEVVASIMRRHNDHIQTRRDSAGYFGTSGLGW